MNSMPEISTFSCVKPAIMTTTLITKYISLILILFETQIYIYLYRLSLKAESFLWYVHKCVIGWLGGRDS